MARRRWSVSRVKQGCVCTHCPPPSGCTGCNQERAQSLRPCLTLSHPVDCGPPRLLMSTGLSSQECWRGLPCQDRALMRHTRGEKQRQRRSHVRTDAEAGGRREKDHRSPKRITRNAGPGKDTRPLFLIFQLRRLETNPENDASRHFR